MRPSASWLPLFVCDLSNMAHMLLVPRGVSEGMQLEEHIQVPTLGNTPLTSPAVAYFPVSGIPW